MEKKEKIKGTIKNNVSLMKTPLMSILPGQISFFVVLSIIPLASVLVMIISKLSFNYISITNFVANYLPSAISSVILSIFEEQKVGVFDIVFIVSAFYLATKATHSIIIASTQIYNGKQRDFVRTRIKAILILIIFVLLVVAVTVVIALGGRLVNYLGENNAIYPVAYWTYKILKWPFAFFMIFFTVKVIYTVAPNVNIPSNSVNKGALFTTVVWVASTFVYSFYLTNFANYSKFYGNLSNIIILMFWIYWLCYIFVYGMTLNEHTLSEKNEKEKSLE